MSKTRIALIVLAVLFGSGWWITHPVCKPLSAPDLAGFQMTPIAQRTDRNLYFREFQQRDGQWCQCRTWLSQRLF
jgi:hypothetical protein